MKSALIDFRNKIQKIGGNHAQKNTFIEIWHILTCFQNPNVAKTALNGDSEFFMKIYGIATNVAEILGAGAVYYATRTLYCQNERLLSKI